MTTLIKDLINIPEKVHKGDFVLRLTEGITDDHAKATLDNYVVTPQLVECFDEALHLVKGAVDQNSSKSTYLHGSFGCGKSHFMAVLHLLLRGHPAARSVAELQPLLTKHQSWIEGKRFLLAPYHMIGAKSMESAILGGYVDYVRRIHPKAPLPAVYQSDDLLENAQTARSNMGDETFFRVLNSGAQGEDSDDEDDDWGELDTTWDAESFETALKAAPRSDQRASLVSDLVQTHFPAYQRLAAEGEHLVTLDDGLSAIAKHAKALGYDAVILFLDELILWLASHMGDQAFVTREGQKVAKLVEATTADRPIPIVSLIARQRDLRELVGDHVPGAEHLSFADVLQWWEGRFGRINLEDRNLPEIAQKRLLKPKSTAARQQIEEDFEKTTRVREDVMDVLLTSQADRDLFRKVYPFSPAFVQTLVAVSSALQRERTAIKMLVMYLSQNRETLALGHLVPVGDLFDLISEGDEPFSADMAIHFKNAKDLYHRKLLPLLEKEHDLRWEQVRKAGAEDAKARAFLADARLLKTLLLAALVPEVETLKNLTAPKLAALNHGTIRSPIPGREAQIVLSKLRKWAGQVGEIRPTGPDTNPTFSVQVSGVETESILEKAKVHDNRGNKRRKIQELIFGQLGLSSNELFVRHSFTWRGTAREVDVLFGNVRELPFESLRAQEPTWKLVIDFPFDDAGKTPLDDVNHLRQFEEQSDRSHTLCWLPAFFSLESQKDLGTLVILDHILAGERFSQYASHLSPTDRASAKLLLENRQSQLRQHLINVLEGAYGIASPLQDSLDTAHTLETHVYSLDPSFAPRPPVGANLNQALRHLLDQALKHQFRKHPDFSAEKDPEDAVRKSQVKKVADELIRVVQEGDRDRADVDKPLRPLLRRIAQPLGLGTMHESAFQLSHSWRQHFDKCHARDKGALSVEKLRAWTDDPDPRGLPDWAQDLLILVFAAQTQRTFEQHGAPVEGALGKLEDDFVLKEQRLPTADTWKSACDRASRLLGLAPSPLLNASNVAKLSSDLVESLRPLRDPARQLTRQLKDLCKEFDLPTDSTARYQTALAGQRVCEEVLSAAEGDRLDTFAGVESEATPEAVGTSLKQADKVAKAIENTKWALLEAVFALQDDRQEKGAAIRTRLGEAIAHDELAKPLGPALRDAETEAVALLAVARPTPPLPPVDPPPPPIQPPPPPKPGRRRVSSGERNDLSAADAQALFKKLEAELNEDGSRRIRLSWEIEGDE